MSQCTAYEPPSLVSEPAFAPESECHAFSPASLPGLPPFEPISSTQFYWYDREDGSAIASLIEEAYSEIVHWRRNLFNVPSAAVGKAFVMEQGKYLELTPMVQRRSRLR